MLMLDPKSKRVKSTNRIDNFTIDLNCGNSYRKKKLSLMKKLKSSMLKGDTKRSTNRSLVQNAPQTFSKKELNDMIMKTFKKNLFKDKVNMKKLVSRKRDCSGSMTKREKNNSFGGQLKKILIK